MENMWEWKMDRLGNFGSFQERDFGRTSVVLFQLILLVLGGKYCEIRKRQKI